MTLILVRVLFVLATVADAVTTGYGLRHGAVETNPILKVSPVIVMGILTVIVFTVAEVMVGHDRERAAMFLYVLATAVHVVAAVWNVTQLSRIR